MQKCVHGMLRDIRVFGGYLRNASHVSPCHSLLACYNLLAMSGDAEQPLAKRQRNERGNKFRESRQRW